MNMVQEEVDELRGILVQNIGKMYTHVHTYAFLLNLIVIAQFFKQLLGMYNT